MMTRKNFKMSDPTTWAIDPTRMIPDMMTRSTAASGDASGLIPTATIAAVAYHPAETAADVTVTTPIGQPPIVSEHEVVTLTNTKRHTAVTQCEQCGGDYTPRRPHGRFCSSYCRRLAWLDRNPEKAAALAERDRQRLREHVIGCGGEWREDMRLD